MIDGEVTLTLVLMDTYITLMIWIGHLMSLPVTKLENIPLTVRLCRTQHSGEQKGTEGVHRR